MAVQNCHEVLVAETINLLKTIGAEQGQEVLLKKMLFLFQHKGNTTETVVCDRISYAEGRDGNQFYMVSMDGGYVRSDVFLSLSSMQTIYEEVRRVVREY